MAVAKPFSLIGMILKLKRTPCIYLVGFMGSGKSTVGRALAEELGWNFSDLDVEIERRAQASIADIFDQRGEAVFREIESAVLRERVRVVESGRPYVIALGGGAFLSEENCDLASNHGVTVWLDCPFSSIERRLQGDTQRPLARDMGQLRSLFEARSCGYGRAHYRVEFLDDDPLSAVAQILALPLF
jgi:shikimate kinase